MAEVNEEIIEQYLKVVKKWFYITDIPFKVKWNYSNIDLLACDPLNKNYYDIEVKYRSAYSLTNNREGINFLTEQFLKYEKERNNKISDILGNIKTKKIIITTFKMLGMTLKKRNSMEKKFHKYMNNKNYESEIWYFDNIIPELVNQVEEKGRYNTQLLQTIRMIKTYNKKTGD